MNTMPAHMISGPSTQRSVGNTGAQMEFGQGGMTFSAGGENHRIYIKESPTGLGKGIEGHVMVNHPTTNKGKWDTIDLTEKAGAKTVAQGVAATKKWHRENPEYADGGWTGYPDHTMYSAGMERFDRVRDYTKYADGGPVSNKDSMSEDLFELVDPTGFSSWDDVKDAYNRTGISPETTIEALGALPVIGKFGKVIKGFKLGTDFFKEAKLSKTLRAIDKATKIDQTTDILNSRVKVPVKKSKGGPVSWEIIK